MLQSERDEKVTALLNAELVFNKAVIKETKERERPTKRICFFGDGSFKAMRGNAPVPRARVRSGKARFNICIRRI